MTIQINKLLRSFSTASKSRDLCGVCREACSNEHYRPTPLFKYVHDDCLKQISAAYIPFWRTLPPNNRGYYYYESMRQFEEKNSGSIKSITQAEGLEHLEKLFMEAFDKTSNPSNKKYTWTKVSPDERI